jgi:hypothetical protein
VALLAYLGLASLGWGGFAPFFSHSALIALTIVLFALSGVAIFSGGNLSRGVREDRANRWVIVAFGLIGVLAAYLPAYTDRKGFLTLDGDAIRWLGVVLFAAGGALRIWPVFVLGHRFSGLVAIPSPVTSWSRAASNTDLRKFLDTSTPWRRCTTSPSPSLGRWPPRAVGLMAILNSFAAVWAGVRCCYLRL